MKTRIALAAVLLGAVAGALAQNTGELWEITTQMNVPGMPAGMSMPGMGGARRVCGGDDPERAQQDQKRDCKVSDRKQSGSRMTMTITCKDGTSGTIDHQYNAGRTEFKSTMTMKSRDGDMQMVTNGRKVGTCNLQEARKEQDKQVAAVKGQMAAATAAAAAQTKEAEGKMVKQCDAGLAEMDYRGFGMVAQCAGKAADPQCKSYAQTFPDGYKTCQTRMAEYCKRYQTADGFLKAKGDEQAAKVCGITTASVKAAQCPRVAQSQSPLMFLGTYCPVEAKPLAQEHCTGRDYTSRNAGKYGGFCQAYLAQNSLDRSAAQGGGQQATGQVPGGGQPSSGDPVQDGISKGINKLKGLFGR